MSAAVIVYAANVIAILTLVFACYFPRYRRRDLVVAYLGVNVGVMAVASALLDSAVSAGLGLGLFGVLSIIRLRSDELTQHEIAYYFSALALGLLSGLATGPIWLPITLMAVIVGVMYVADHPHFLSRYRRQLMVLDHAYDTEAAVRPLLAERLGARIHGLTIVKVDHVNDSTTVDVRYELPESPATEQAPAPDDLVAASRTTVAAQAPAGMAR